jgi:hypothetical protein
MGKKGRLQTALRIRENDIKTYHGALAKLSKEKPKDDSIKKKYDGEVERWTKALETAQKEVETIKTRIAAA